MQDFAFPCVELHEILVSTFLQPAEILLNGNTTIYCYQLPIIHIINEEVGPSINPRGYTNNVRLQLDFVLLVTTL